MKERSTEECSQSRSRSVCDVDRRCRGGISRTARQVAPAANSNMSGVDMSGAMWKLGGVSWCYLPLILRAVYMHLVFQWPDICAAAPPSRLTRTRVSVHSLNHRSSSSSRPKPVLPEAPPEDLRLSAAALPLRLCLPEPLAGLKTSEVLPPPWPDPTGLPSIACRQPCCCGGCPPPAGVPCGGGDCCCEACASSSAGLAGVSPPPKSLSVLPMLKAASSAAAACDPIEIWAGSHRRLAGSH